MPGPSFFFLFFWVTDLKLALILFAGTFICVTNYFFSDVKKLTQLTFDRCIPFRYKNSDETGDVNSEKIIEVLMINSPSGPGLLFPKVFPVFYWHLKLLDLVRSFFLNFSFWNNLFLDIIYFSSFVLLIDTW